jgi:hypothetical protein
MPERRPPWCKEIECPNWPGYDFCYLKEYISRGWERLSSRRRELVRIQDAATRNSQEVVEECREAMVKI